MSGGIKRIGNSRARALSTGVGSIPSRQALIKINQLQFPIETKLNSVTMTTNWSNTTVNAQMRRVGQFAQFYIQGSTSAAPASGTLTFTMPAGMTIDTSFINGSQESRIGEGRVVDTGTREYPAWLLMQSSTIIVARYGTILASINTGTGVTPTAPFTWGSTDNFDFYFEVPILGWDANGIGTIEEIIERSVFDVAGLLRRGRTDGSVPGVGEVGETLKTAIANGVTQGATGVWTNVLNASSLSLTAGYWAVTSMLETESNGATVTNQFATAISLFSGATTTDHVNGDNVMESVGPTGTTQNAGNVTITNYIINVPASSSPLTVYFKSRQLYTGGPPLLWGHMKAIRIA